jgi:hypothetical protein
VNIFASLVFGEFTIAQGEAVSTIRIADSLGEARNSGRGLVSDRFRGIDRIDLAGAGIELEYEAIAFARGQRRSTHILHHA